MHARSIPEITPRVKREHSGARGALSWLKNSARTKNHPRGKCSCRTGPKFGYALVLDADLIEFARARDATEPQIQTTRAAECRRWMNWQPNKRKAETSSNRVSHSLCQRSQQKVISLGKSQFLKLISSNAYTHIWFAISARYDENTRAFFSTIYSRGDNILRHRWTKH